MAFCGRFVPVFIKIGGTNNEKIPKNGNASLDLKATVTLMISENTLSGALRRELKKYRDEEITDVLPKIKKKTLRCFFAPCVGNVLKKCCHF